MAAPAGEGDDRAEALKLYELAVDEYRFQVQLNWDRSKYLLGFTVAIIGLGAGLLRVGDRASPFLVFVFVVGLFASLLSLLVIHLQHGYYQRTRDVMTAQGRGLGLAERAVSTTPGARGERTTWSSRLLKVQTALYLFFVSCSLVNVIGILFVFLT